MLPCFRVGSPAFRWKFVSLRSIRVQHYELPPKGQTTNIRMLSEGIEPPTTERVSGATVRRNATLPAQRLALARYAVVKEQRSESFCTQSAEAARSFVSFAVPCFEISGAGESAPAGSNLAP